MEYISHVSENVGTLVQTAGANANYGPINFQNHQPVAYQPSSDFQPDESANLVPSSNDIEAPMHMTASHSTGWAVREEWTKREAEIRQLYVHENKTLKEVKCLMESRHGFKATSVLCAVFPNRTHLMSGRDKMYKTHIRQWGLDKKNKEPEMRAIVRKHKQRADQGKPSTIHVRGRIRTIVEAFRYWERKGVSTDEIIARQTASPTPEAVMFSTPVPSPILTPQVHAIPERMFHLVQDYCKGSFESGTWFSKDPLRVCRSIKDGKDAHNDWLELADGLQLACSLSSRNLSYEAEQTLRKAVTNIKQILLAEYPAALSEIFSLMVRLRDREEAEIALRQFFVMGKALLGSEHPLSRICECCCKIYAAFFGDIAIRCVEIVFSQFEISLGPLHLSTLYSRLNLIEIGRKGGERRVQELKKLLREFEDTLQPEDPRVMRVREWTADACLVEGRYEDAMSLIQPNIAQYQDRSLTNAEYHHHSDDLYLLAMCQQALGEIDLGIETLHQAIDLRISDWGTQDAQARTWLLFLENWYLEQGLEENAAIARELSLITLISMDVD